jgi:sulfite exporter TauE/SafE
MSVSLKGHRATLAHSASNSLFSNKNNNLINYLLLTILVLLIIYTTYKGFEMYKEYKLRKYLKKEWVDENDND